MFYEDDVEGTFWRYGTDLADLYRDEMTLRQLWVRMKSGAHDDPLAVALRAGQERAEKQAKSREHDDTLRLVDPNWKG